MYKIQNEPLSSALLQSESPVRLISLTLIYDTDYGAPSGHLAV